MSLVTLGFFGLHHCLLYVYFHRAHDHLLRNQLCAIQPPVSIPEHLWTYENHIEHAWWCTEIKSPWNAIRPPWITTLLRVEAFLFVKDPRSYAVLSQTSPGFGSLLNVIQKTALWRSMAYVSSLDTRWLCLTWGRGSLGSVWWPSLHPFAFLNSVSLSKNPPAVVSVTKPGGGSFHVKIDGLTIHFTVHAYSPVCVQQEVSLQ